MKNMLIRALAPALFVLAAEPALAAAGTTSVLSLFTEIETLLYGASTVIVTIAFMWSGYQVLFNGQPIHAVAKPLLGGILIGASGYLAGFLVG